MNGMQGFQTCNESHEGIRERADAAGRKNERLACASFLELLADQGVYGLPPESLRRIAGHLREREKWEEILAARAKAQKLLPWEAT